MWHSLKHSSMEQAWEKTHVTAGDIQVNREATVPCGPRIQCAPREGRAAGVSRGGCTGSPSPASQSPGAEVHVLSMGEWGAALLGHIQLSMWLSQLFCDWNIWGWGWVWGSADMEEPTPFTIHWVAFRCYGKKCGESGLTGGGPSKGLQSCLGLGDAASGQDSGPASRLPTC